MSGQTGFAFGDELSALASTRPVESPSAAESGNNALPASSGNGLLSASPNFQHMASQSYGERDTGNVLIQGENLRALRALQPRLAGKVRCAYIDPPYNNQEKYRHYADAWGHREWLAMLAERLSVIRTLLTEDGSVWISIDDREMHYLKVAMDEIWGRDNFIATVVWEQRTTRENRRAFSHNHEYILVCARDCGAFRAKRNLLPASPELLARYRNPDADPRGPWQSVSANVQDGHATAAQHYALAAPNGAVHYPPEGRCWAYTEEKMRQEIVAGNIWFGPDGKGVPRIKRFLSGAKLGLTPETLWPAAEVGTNDEAKKQLLQLLQGEAVFDTPKPEALIARILSIASSAGDLVLDPFLGSGTTAAVAHKTRRRYIGIEEGSQMVTHCVCRLRQVVSGDRTGCSGTVGWRGGGGFDFYRMQGAGERS